MYLTVNKEKEIEAKGYHYFKGFDGNETQAKKCAKELRSDGLKAFVGEYATMVKGYHNYCVWCK